MAGSIRLVKGEDVWEVRAFLGGCDSTGRVHHRYATFQGSKREATRALASLVAETERQQTTAQRNGPVLLTVRVEAQELTVRFDAHVAEYWPGTSWTCTHGPRWKDGNPSSTPMLSERAGRPKPPPPLAPPEEH